MQAWWGREEVGREGSGFPGLHSLLPTAEGVGTFERPIPDQITRKGDTRAPAQQPCRM